MATVDVEAYFSRRATLGLAGGEDAAAARSRLEEGVREGRSRSGTTLDERGFLETLAAEPSPVVLLSVDDLCLARAAAAGVSTALAHFDDGPLAKAVKTALKRNRSSESADELAQRLRTKLFVDGKLARYRGLAPLAKWLVVLATRELVMAKRARSNDDVPLEPEVLESVVAPAGDDPERALLRVRHQAQLREALSQGMGALTPRQRNLLRSELLDRVPVAELAEVYAVHRVTMSRWLAEARADLVAATRTALKAQLGSGEAVSSVVRALASDFDASFARLLGATAETTGR